MKYRFDAIPNGTFFRFPGKPALFKKVPVRYESTLEVNVQSQSTTFHFLNGPTTVI